MVLVGCGLTACTYQVGADTTQQEPVFTAYANKVPGKWSLQIDALRASAALKADGLRCSQFNYPLDLAKVFTQSAAEAFRTVTEDVRVTDHPLSQAEFASEGYTGVIRVRVEDLRAKAKVEGVFDATADADTEIDGAIIVTKGGQRMVDIKETGKGTAQRDAGLICQGTTEAVSSASIDAVQDVIRKLAEQFANSHDVRYSVPSFSPATSQ
jgi:hypothetical protein